MASSPPDVSRSPSPSSSPTPSPTLHETPNAQPRQPPRLNSFRRSPLNPNTTRSSLRSSSFPLAPSEESQALRHRNGSMGSMILYRLAEPILVPPTVPFGHDGSNRGSVASSSNSSIGGPRGMVPYFYDPTVDFDDDGDEDDYVDYLPTSNPAAQQASRSSKNGVRLASLTEKSGTRTAPTSSFGPSWRGLMNLGMLVVLTLGLLCLFIFYPVYHYFSNTRVHNMELTGNLNTNSSGQAVDIDKMTLPALVDRDTPENVKSRTGFDGDQYELVFSDEFNMDGRSFYPGDDPFWEAVDLWYGVTHDLEWYDPNSITTKDGKLVITMTDTGAPSPDKNHGMQYKSGMLQSWNKFCFTGGYVEVAVSLPGPDANAAGYWPGAWLMGNLARPGYAGATDGTWPYSYDACDVGTFPNQTTFDKSGPAAALQSDQSSAKYDMQLSWLPGQRASACTCPGQDHPGPSNDKGRGAPELDIFEASLNSATKSGQTASQSAQFAPFAHDYVHDTTQLTITDSSITRANGFDGSAVQQTVSALTELPANVFHGSGQELISMGVEFFADPNNRDSGYVNWQVANKQSAHMGALAVPADQGSDGTGVSRRLIPEEPMGLVLNLGISQDWQDIDTSTLSLPGIMLIDYVRVYQKKGQTNIGCNPKDYPTTDYIANHSNAYYNVNATSWRDAGYTWPKNSQYDGC